MSFRTPYGTTRIVKNSKTNTSIVTDTQVLPTYTSGNYPTGQSSRAGGAIAFDQTIRKLIYFDGFSWIPVTGSGSSVRGFCYFLTAPLDVQNSGPETLLNWSSSPSPPFSALPNFNPVTGVYTATAPVTIFINVGISWSGGYSTVGLRKARIVYDNGVQTDIKTAETQPDPNINVETTQELSATATLDIGDKLYVVVEQTSPVQVRINSGVKTTISGLELG